MNTKLSKILGRVNPGDAVAKSIAIVLSYLFGVYVTGRIHEASMFAGAILACTSTVIVMQQTDIKIALKAGALRLVGTIIGAVIAILYLMQFKFSLVGMAVAVFVLDIICMILKVPDNGKTGTITLVVIMVVSIETPDLSPLMNGVLRFSEAAIGVAVGIGMVLLTDLLRRIIRKKEQKKSSANSAS